VLLCPVTCSCCCFSSPPPLAPPQALKHHIDDEENEMLVDYAQHVDRAKLEELSKAFQRSKASVPTR
jgi:hypothetical protein